MGGRTVSDMPSRPERPIQTRLDPRSPLVIGYWVSTTWWLSEWHVIVADQGPARRSLTLTVSMPASPTLATGGKRQPAFQGKSAEGLVSRDKPGGAYATWLTRSSVARAFGNCWKFLTSLSVELREAEHSPLSEAREVAVRGDTTMQR